jgi:hypothetical protein
MRQPAHLLSLLLVFAAQALLAQGDGLGSWNILNLKYMHMDKLSFFAEGQLRSLRFYDHFHYYEYKGGINYKWQKSLHVALGAGSYQTYREGGDFVLPKNNDEFRLWPQVLLLQELWGFRIEQRYRSELRWTSNGYRNRFRYRIGISHPVGRQKNGTSPVQVGFSNELFFTDREPYFERNRLQFTLSGRVATGVSLQVGYLRQFDYRINDETGRDFLVVGFYYEISRRHAGEGQPQSGEN